ncbi:MAG TPA: rhodanese-like domain-containing protein [Mariprofundaceae bacterium]|nr:rhodanese-like domain-containing protein [Mariprofundaceae bacterium]
MISSIDVNSLYPRWLTAAEKEEACTIIDVRTPEEYIAGHVPSARLLPLSTIMARGHEVPKEGKVYVICQAGGRSAQAAGYLAQQFGHDNLINVAGGTMAWTSAGYPVEKGGHHED